jgi:ankyrin repeat protein
MNHTYTRKSVVSAFALIVGVYSHAMEPTSTPTPGCSPINMVDSEGYAPLHRAFASNNRGGLVRFLLAQKADVNMKTQKEGMTSLHLAAQQCTTDIIPSLLAARADICITDGLRRTPFALAIQNNNIEAAKLLLGSPTENTTPLSNHE